MSDFPINLVGDLVCVQPEGVRQQGKIFIPDWARSLHGKIVAKGPDATQVEIGETATFVATSGMESVFNGAAVRIMREGDLDVVVG